MKSKMVTIRKVKYRFKLPYYNFTNYNIFVLKVQVNPIFTQINSTAKSDFM